MAIRLSKKAKAHQAKVQSNKQQWAAGQRQNAMMTQKKKAKK